MIGNVILGADSWKESLQHQIDESTYGDEITLHGAATSKEINHFLGQADVFALMGGVEISGRVETQGVVLIEAQAVGLPVITSNTLKHYRWRNGNFM